MTKVSKDARFEWAEAMQEMRDTDQDLQSMIRMDEIDDDE